MGEIKSTLDMIMEKTRGLTMSDEEKRAYRQKELEDKLRGLILKYMDGRMKLENFRMEFEAAGKDKKEAARRIVVKDLLQRIEPDGENNPILEALEQVGKIDCQPLCNLLDEYRDDPGGRGAEQLQFLEILKEEGISGSAVIPNIKADPQYLQRMEERKADFQKKLDALSAQWMEK